MIHSSKLTIEIAEMIADHFGRPTMDADYRLADQIIERAYRHTAELKAEHDGSEGVAAQMRRQAEMPVADAARQADWDAATQSVGHLRHPEI